MGRSNNFHSIRLAAALAVIAGHGFVLLGERVPRVAGVPLHSLGVAVFFCVSGFLIAGSADRTPGLGRFFWHRVLRIFTALIVLVAITVLVIGPLSTSLSLSSYFASSRTWAYWLNALLLAQYDLPGVFQAADHARTAVNGSLWTLGVEFGCYVGVMAIWFAPRRLRGVLYLLALGALAAAASLGGSVGSSAALCAFFAAAAAIRLLVPRTWLRWPVAGVACVLIALAAMSSFAEVVLWVALPVVVIVLGTKSVPGLRRASRWGDFSYGLYLWGYPVQQIVLDVTGPLDALTNFLLVVGCTLTLAVASWWFVERPALALKSVSPKRRVVA